MPDNGYDLAQDIQSSYISKQKPAPVTVDDKMKAQLQSYPPLGQVTLLQDAEPIVTAVLEIDKSRGNEPWEVSLWYSSDEADWTDLCLQSLGNERKFQALDVPPSENTVRLYFSSKLFFKKSIHFTLKFRHNESEDWRWIRDEYGLNDGIIVKNSDEAASEKLSDLIPDLNTEWKVSSCVSQSPGTRVWALEVPIPPANGDDSNYKDITIGTPWGSFLRWFALVRLWSPWLAPRHGKTDFRLDKDAILCSFLGANGSNLVFLAVSGISEVLCELRHTDDGALMAHARTDGLAEEKITILVSEGAAFENAIAAAMYRARTLVSRAHQTESSWNQELATLTNDFKPEWMENWYDGLGFCTWNALGQRLTEQKVFDAVDKLAESKINISSLIIDDNWQSIDYKGSSQFQYGWNEFEAEPKAFPSGLKHTISHIRNKHPAIKHIAVWHALLGYWGGISPGGKIAKTYKTMEVDRKDAKRRDLPLGGKMLVVAKEDVSRFYNDFYTFLEDCGVDAVKTDAQFMVDTWVEAGARRDLIKTYLDAWTLSTLRHFSAKAISCMSQIPQALFYSQMPTNRPTILVRNSDDFFPEVPASHPWHVWVNAYNAIFMKHLNVLPDWDMFQTVHDYSGFHAAARCVSGGPIYITDVPGSHNMDLISQMTGTTPRGRTVIFRPSVLGRAIYPYMGYDDDSLLKVGSYHGASQTGTPILAVFNISARSLTELIPLSCFPGTISSTKYVVRAHGSGKVSAPTTGGGSNLLITASLPVRGYEIYCAFPLTSISSQKHGNILISNLGLLGKMTGAAAITGSSITTRENNRALLDTRLKAFGILGLYISSLPDMTVDGDFMVTIRDQPIPPHTVSISSIDPHVLEIDIGAAWKDMELKPGWSNEIEVKIHFDV